MRDVAWGIIFTLKRYDTTLLSKYLTDLAICWFLGNLKTNWITRKFYNTSQLTLKAFGFPCLSYMFVWLICKRYHNNNKGNRSEYLREDFQSRQNLILWGQWCWHLPIRKWPSLSTLTWQTAKGLQFEDPSFRFTEHKMKIKKQE